MDCMALSKWIRWLYFHGLGGSATVEYSESGQNDGDHMHITKKGNKRLRCLLYLAVTCSIRLKRDDNSIKDFYIKKKQQSNPMCSKAAKTACASKLVRIIYSMCKTGELYQYNK